MLIWNRPRLVMIELTNLCNLRCYMCGIWEETPKRIFDLGLYERLVSRPPSTLPVDVNAGESLPGPTGETNTLYLRPRGRVACVADTERALMEQIRVATATGNIALLPASAASERVRDAGGGACELVADPLASEPDAVLFAGGASGAQELRRRLAALPGPIVPLIVAGANGYDRTRLVNERTITINTTASGGNASLLSLTETPA